MTEVVTSAAATLQPVLQAIRLQAFGAGQPDAVISDQSAAVAATREDVAVQSTQVPQPSGDRSSVEDYSAGNGSFASAFGASSGSAGGQDSGQAAPATTGPARAVVNVPIVSTPAGQIQPQPEGSVLDAAQDLDDPDLENMAEDVVGTAFAPPEVDPALPGPRAAGQKDVIFDGHKVFGGQVPHLAPVVTTGTGVAAAASGTFAAAAEAAQQDVAGSSGGTGTAPTFYERAQAVAQALGARAPGNPGVKQLVTELAAYGAGTRAPAPTVTVTA